ncbi:MAG TPA: YceI family protein [Cytophagales bacterium]|nr:YceI family protein [Cytophagales bacterium]
MKQLTFFCFLIFFSSLSLAQTYSTNRAQAEVSGETSVASYTGVSDKLEGKMNLETNKVDFKIPIKSIDTDNNTRNRHMFEAMEVSKFPNAEFHGKIISPFDPNKKVSQTVKVKGDLTIHGKTRAFETNVQLTPKGEGIEFSSEWKINITDFGIERPSVLFMKVDDQHTISIKGILTK